MNQILVTEKLYVTPELKRKKLLYKINFIISIIVIVVLCSVYIHSEYAKNQEQQISEEILSSLIEEQGLNESEQAIADEEDEGVWKIMAATIEQRTIEEQNQQQYAYNQNQQQANNDNIQNQQPANNGSQNPITNPVIAANTNTNTGTSTNSDVRTTVKTNTNTKTNTSTNTSTKKTTYITVNGKRYPSIGRIRIPKINLDLAILDQATGDTLVSWLKISPTKFWGPELNEVGNVSIAGHNYRNTRFFSKVPTLTTGDKIKVTDTSNRTVTYKVFKKYEVDPKNTDCINPIEGKENKRVLTLITCTNNSKKRVIIHAEEV